MGSKGDEVDLGRVDQIAREVMLTRAEHSPREPCWLYYHGHRTGKIAQWLAEALHEKLDEDVLYTGALFHDVGKGREPHNEIGAQQASELLASICTPGEIAGICELIRQHTQRID